MTARTFELEYTISSCKVLFNIISFTTILKGILKCLDLLEDRLCPPSNDFLPTFTKSGDSYPILGPTVFIGYLYFLRTTKIGNGYLLVFNPVLLNGRTSEAYTLATNSNYVNLFSNKNLNFLDFSCLFS